MSKGFSLLEVLVALSIITIGLVGALSLIAFSLHSYQTSSQQIIDANNAQACAEIARNQRDRGQAPTGGIDRGDYYEIRCSDIVYYLYKWR